MDRGAAFRRAFHIASPAFLAYYLLPESITPNITRLSLALLFIGTAGCIEIARIALGVRLFGMRPYEGQRVSAYAQGLLGLTIGIFLVRDPRIVVPVFFGMAWIDPFAAYTRRREWSLVLPAVAYFVLFLGTEYVLGFVQGPGPLVFAALATLAAIAVEGPFVPQVDDDLLMQLVPYAVLSAAAFLLPAWVSL